MCAFGAWHTRGVSSWWIPYSKRTLRHMRPHKLSTNLLLQSALQHAQYTALPLACPPHTTPLSQRMRPAFMPAGTKALSRPPGGCIANPRSHTTPSERTPPRNSQKTGTGTTPPHQQPKDFMLTRSSPFLIPPKACIDPTPIPKPN